MIKYVFSINTGRSGSQYLHKLFHACENSYSFHENKPIGNGKAMRNFLNGNVVEMQEIARTKKQIIDEQRPNDAVYTETNHCFIKGFGWELVQLLPNEEIAVIILDRNKKDVASSLLRVSASPLDKDGKNWIILPCIKDPKIPPPCVFINATVSYYTFLFLKKIFRLSRLVPGLKKDTPEFIRRYEIKCLEWYVDEISAMTEAFKKTFGKIHYLSVNIEELNSGEKVYSLLDELNLKHTRVLSNIIGTPSNTGLQRS